MVRAHLALAAGKIGRLEGMSTGGMKSFSWPSQQTAERGAVAGTADINNAFVLAGAHGRRDDVLTSDPRATFGTLRARGMAGFGRSTTWRHALPLDFSSVSCHPEGAIQILNPQESLFMYPPSAPYLATHASPSWRGGVAPQEEPRNMTTIPTPQDQTTRDRHRELVREAGLRRLERRRAVARSLTNELSASEVEFERWFSRATMKRE